MIWIIRKPLQNTVYLISKYTHGFGNIKRVVRMLSGINEYIASGGSSRTSLDLEQLIGESTPLEELVREGLAMKTS